MTSVNNSVFNLRCHSIVGPKDTNLTIQSDGKQVASLANGKAATFSILPEGIIQLGVGPKYLQFAAKTVPSTPTTLWIALDSTVHSGKWTTNQKEEPRVQVTFSYGNEVVVASTTEAVKAKEDVVESARKMIEEINSKELAALNEIKEGLKALITKINEPTNVYQQISKECSELEDKVKDRREQVVKKKGDVKDSENPQLKLSLALNEHDKHMKHIKELTDSASLIESQLKDKDAIIEQCKKEVADTDSKVKKVNDDIEELRRQKAGLQIELTKLQAEDLDRADVTKCNDLEKELNKLSLQNGLKSEEQVKLNKVLDDLKAKLSQENKENDTLKLTNDSLIKEQERLMNELKDLAAKKDAALKELNDVKNQKDDSFEAEKKKLMDEITNLEKAKDNWGKKEKEYKDKISDLGNKLNQIKIIGSLDKDHLKNLSVVDIKKLETENMDTQKAILNLESGIIDLKAKIKEDGLCSNVNTKLKEISATLDELIKKRAAFNLMIKELEKRAREQEKEIEDLEDQLALLNKEGEKNAAKKKDADAKFDKIHKDLEAAQGEYNLKKEELDRLQKELNGLEDRIKDLDSKEAALKKTLEDLLKKVDDLSNKLAEKRKETEDKQKQLKDALAALENAKKQYAKEVDNIDQEIAMLKAKIDAANKEKENQLNISKEYDEQFAQLKEKIAECEKSIKDLENSPKQVSEYTAEKGDLVDEMLARLLRGRYCPVSFRKIGKGWYMFGTKKIYANILNDELVIRVGGGYMNLDEFLKTYTQSELEKAKRAGLRGSVLLTSGEKSPGSSSSLGKSSPMGKVLLTEDQIKEMAGLAEPKTEPIVEEKAKKNEV